MKFKVKFTQITHSRYGAYPYKASEIVEAASESEAIAIVKEMWGKYENSHNGQYKLIIRDAYPIND